MKVAESPSTTTWIEMIHSGVLVATDTTKTAAMESSPKILARRLIAPCARQL